MSDTIKDKLQKVFDQAMIAGDHAIAIGVIDRLSMIEKEEAEKKPA